MPRVGLTTAVVVETAAQMLDERDGEGVNVASLAERLGVKPPSLYKHVNGMPGLRRGVMLRAKAELAEALGRAAIGKARDDAVRSAAMAYREWATAHPAQYRMAMRAPVSGDHEDEDVSATLVEMLYTILSGYRIAEEDLVDAARFFRATLHGFVDLETTGAFQLPRSLERSYERLIASLTAALHSWGEP